jgi:SWIM zinc finger
VADTSLAQPAHDSRTRELRALALYRGHDADIVLVDKDVWSVPSGSRAGLYHEVTYPAAAPEGKTCSCEHYRYNGGPCVHILQAAIKAAKRRRAARTIAPVLLARVH